MIGQNIQHTKPRQMSQFDWELSDWCHDSEWATWYALAVAAGLGNPSGPYWAMRIELINRRQAAGGGPPIIPIETATAPPTSTAPVAQPAGLNHLSSRAPDEHAQKPTAVWDASQ